VNTLSLCLPESLHRHARSLAKHEGISVSQLISSAPDEKLAALETFD
jgi:predicted HicB family RNase H-like nuclease